MPVCRCGNAEVPEYERREVPELAEGAEGVEGIEEVEDPGVIIYFENENEYHYINELRGLSE